MTTSTDYRAERLTKAEFVLPSVPTQAPTASELPAPQPPSLTRMVTSATQSAIQFAAGGGKVLRADEQQARMNTCRSCDELAGARCHACGCFVAVKTWLPHERCPLGKWSMQPADSH